MFTACKIKNISGGVESLHGHEFSVNEIYTIPDNMRVSWAQSNDVIVALTDSDFEIYDGNGLISGGVSNQISWLQNYLPHLIEIEKQPAFAEPTYRTKINGCASAVSVSLNSSANVDTLIASERYASGGQLIIQNAQFGDYIKACVYDKDSVIPEAYRSTMCENWPVVAEYIEKKWISYEGNNPTVDTCCTYPLNAKITDGLYLRITYYATNSGSTRSILTNYRLTKKL